MYRNELIAIAVAFAASAGCTAQPSSPVDAGLRDAQVIEGKDAGSDQDALPTDAVATQLAESDLPRVKIKEVDILRLDLSDALGIPASELCKELDRFDCFDVHKISLGGLEPYELGIYTPLPEPAATTPIAIERIMLAACKSRVDRDLAGAKLIFDLPEGGAAFPDGSQQAAESVDRLYKRVLRRRATEAETRAIASLYDDVVASSDVKPSRSWAILACFSVTTTMESLFY